MKKSPVSDQIDTIVKQWQAQSLHCDFDAIQIAARILRLSKLLEIHQGQLHAKFGLKPGEFDVLAALSRSPAASLTPSQLHQTMLLSSGAMTSRLDRLEKKQLIRREHCLQDRRSVNVSLTDKGRALIEELVPTHFELLSSLLSSMADSDKTQLASLLRNCLCILETSSEQTQ